MSSAVPTICNAWGQEIDPVARVTAQSQDA